MASLVAGNAVASTLGAEGTAAADSATTPVSSVVAAVACVLAVVEVVMAGPEGLATSFLPGEIEETSTPSVDFSGDGGRGESSEMPPPTVRSIFRVAARICGGHRCG